MLPGMALHALYEYSNRMVDNDGKAWKAVHAACFMNIPLAMVQIVCTAFSEQLQQQDVVYGRLPLHDAAN